jgi:hypothetical protein
LAKQDSESPAFGVIRVRILGCWRAMNSQFSTGLTANRERKFFRVLRSFACGLFFCALVACSFTGPDIDKPVLAKDKNVKLDRIPDMKETVRGEEDPPLVTLQLGRKLQATRLRPSEDLPETVRIGNTNLNNVPVTVALQAVLADTDITLLWDKAELQDRTVTLMNLKGPLPQVVDRICRAAKLLCAYRNGALELMEQDTFVVELPAAPSVVGTGGGGGAANDTITDTIQALVDGKVKVDKTGGNIIYTADADGYERVQSYLTQLRNGRPLIVLQLYIWQVTLDDNQALGINWSQFQPPEFGGTLQNGRLTATSALKAVAAGSGVSLGAVFSGIVDANAVANFLSTQGRVQNISSPQLTFVSGTSAKFENGGVQRFVSQVGTLVSSSVAGATSNTTGVSNNTVSTEDLKLGLSITATGSYESGVVFASLEIKTSDLVKVESINANGTTLQLPQTNDRTVNTILRVRPGDNLVLAGLQTSTDTRSRDGLPTGGTGGTLPLYSSNVVSNSETVILVKPSVVFFSDDGLPVTRSAERPKQPPQEEKVKAEVAVLPPPPAPKQVPAPQPAPVERIAMPTRRNTLQDDMGTAVHRFEDRVTSAPENIKPLNDEVQAP